MAFDELPGNKEKNAHAAALQGDRPCWVIVDVGRVRNLRGGKWGRGVWVCWVAFWKEEVVLGFNRNVQLYSRSWF